MAGDGWGWMGKVGDGGDGYLELISTYSKFINFSLVLMGIASRAGDGWGR